MSQSEVEISTAKKRTRGLRACVACRKAKHRCELPDQLAIQPSGDAQPNHLKCHRCNALKISCVVLEAYPQSQISKANKKSRQSSPDRSHLPSAPNLESYIDSDTPTPTISIDSYGSKEMHDKSTQGMRVVSTSSTPIDAKIIKHSPFAAISSLSSPQASTSQTNPEQQFWWMDVKRSLFKPYVYLAEVCSKQQGFLWSSDRPSPLLGSSKLINIGREERSAGSIQDILGKNADLLDWSRLDQSLDRIRPFAPFLPNLATGIQRWNVEDSDFFIGVCVMLAAHLSGDEELRGIIEPSVESAAVKTLISGPGDAGDVAALALLALYYPLLLTKPVSGEAPSKMALDGSQFMTMAASAARSMQLNCSFKRLSEDYEKSGTQTSSEPEFTRLSGESKWTNGGNVLSEVDLACLCLSIATYMSVMDLTTSDNVQQSLFFQCTEDELKAAEIYCAAGQDTSRRLLLYSIFRFRLFIEARQLYQGNIVATKKSEDSNKSNEANGETFLKLAEDGWNFQRRWLLEIPNYVIRLDGNQSNTTPTSWWLQLDVVQVQVQLMTQLIKIFSLKLSHIIHGSKSVRDFFDLLKQDPSDAKAYDKLGLGRIQALRKWAVLFVSCVRRGDHSPDQLEKLCPPPSQTCTSAIFSVKGLAEYMAGKIENGHSVLAQIEEAWAEEAATISMDVAGALKSLSRTFWPIQSDRRGDIYAASHLFALRTAQVMDEWSAAENGLGIIPPMAIRSEPEHYSNEGMFDVVGMQQSTTDLETTMPSHHQSHNSMQSHLEVDTSLSATEAYYSQILGEILSGNIEDFFNH